MTAALAGGVAASGQAEARSVQGPPHDVFDIGGEVSVLADRFPRRDVVELRPRLVAEVTIEPAAWLRLHAEGLVEGLAGDRSSAGSITDTYGEVREAWVELVANRADLRAGRGRLVWGRLDEVQPSDVINPLDVTKYLLDGRSEARRSVNFVRARVYPAEGFVIEGVLVPRFERGRYDVLDESSSPFNLLNDLVLPAGLALSGPDVEAREPDVSWSSPLGGVRVSATAGRVDFAVAAFEGADGFGVVTFEPAFGAITGLGPPPAPGLAPAVVGRLVQTFSRFRMYAADFETVTGQWAIRGEVAAFTEKQLMGVTVPGAVRGRVIDAGIGIDRRAGDFRVYATGLFHREWSAEDPGVERKDFTVVGSVERSLAREVHLVRAFAVVNPADQSAFLRGLWRWLVADNTALEVSAGAFLGTSDDTLGRFKRRDFVFARLRRAF